MSKIAGVIMVALASALATSASVAQGWQGHAGSAQHTAQALAPAQNLERIRWTLPIDRDPTLVNGELFVHYGSPMITRGNTIILPIKGTRMTSAGPVDAYFVEAREGATGKRLWTDRSDYAMPPHNWLPEYGPALTPLSRVYYPAAGGSVLFRDRPDRPDGASGRHVFYGNKIYVGHEAIYDAAVRINTPITADAAGNIYFGFVVLGPTPANLKSGVARLAPDGTGTWIGAATASGDLLMTQVQTNGAPAVSNDGATIYVPISNGFSGYLVGLDSATLQPKYRARLIDPASGWSAWISNDASSTPMVGPDGDVYMGVLEAPFPSHNDRGWMLHFDATLAKTKIPGSFGWDNTASLVPRSAVPHYTGRSPYLLFTKYNNYLGFISGDGHNRIAILDPATAEPDPIIPRVPVMAEYRTALGPTQFPGAPIGARYEWCINTGAVDPATHSAFGNGEDGYLYRMDVDTGAITQRIKLNDPRPEAYTWTAVGPDGTVYSINNSTVYAVGNK